MNAFTHAKRRPRTARERATIYCAACGVTIVTYYGYYRAKRRGYGYCSQSCEASIKRARSEDAIKSRTWGRIQQSHANDCWEFTGRRLRGYGVVDFNGRPMLAHRLVYQWHHSVNITPNQVVCHACDNPGCCNPHHLWLGTQPDNARDMWSKGRANPVGAVGEAHGGSKLTVKEIHAIRSSCTAVVDLAREFGVTKTQIRNIQRRKAWRHV